MNKSNVKTMLCASALAIASSAGIAQDQVQPQFTPAVTGRLTTDASSSTLIRVDGARVIDVAGQPVGRIENIVLSPVGCAEAAILTASNGRLVPIPWTLVRVSGDTRAAGAMPGANLVFTVSADQATLAQAPSFVRTQFPDMSSQAWLQPSVAFFGGVTGVGATGGSTNVISGTSTQSAIGTTGTTAAPNSTATTLPRSSTSTTLPTNSTSTTLPRSSTATTVPTNSSSVLPPTGRPNPGQPDFNQPTPPRATPGVPPQNRPPENRPPSGVPPTAPPQNTQP
jgi:hypothetical protein